MHEPMAPKAMGFFVAASLGWQGKIRATPPLPVHVSPDHDHDPARAPARPALTRRQWGRWATGALVLTGSSPLALGGAPSSAHDEEWTASATARQLLRWVAASADNRGMPFVVIDKPEACAHVFSGRGQWLGSAPVLLGLATGDRSVPGIGQRPVAQVRPHERTTPAGRFVTEPGQNLQGEDIVWIDYDAAVSLHRVRSATAIERRLQRLASPRVRERRISYGCINAPDVFYSQHIAPYLGQVPGVAYVLPDSEPFATFFEAARAY